MPASRDQPMSPSPASYRLLFSVPFRSAMRDDQLERLNRSLGMTTNFLPFMHPTAMSPGVERLDFSSGLFLLCDDAPEHWRLDGRTWGDPLPEDIHEWHVDAAAAAQLLDPEVHPPTQAASRGSEDGPCTTPVVDELDIPGPTTPRGPNGAAALGNPPPA